jgi:hypothetical protein
MKVFVSSIISGMQAERAAAREAIRQLGHEPIMAEDFAATPQSPQVACLDGLRRSGAVLLLLGAHYGAKQESGQSATHEEYLEARDRLPVLAFAQRGAEFDPDQERFLREVQAWSTGLFRGEYADPDELRTMATRALHEWELANAAGPVDSAELLSRATAMLPTGERGFGRGESAVLLAVAGGPTQAILRPSEIEKPALANTLLKEALFGDNRLFKPDLGSKPEITDQALVLRQEGDAASITLDPKGGLLIRLTLQPPRGDLVIIQEDVEEQLGAALRYAGWVLDQIDPSHRISRVVPVAMIEGAEMRTFRTRREHDASNGSYSLSIDTEKVRTASLTPPDKPRPALVQNTDDLVEVFVTLLKRGRRRRGY